jgi:hypothetical protein
VAAPNLQVELVFDPLGNRAVVGRSNDSALLRATALQLVEEAEAHADRFAGLNEVAVAEWKSEAERRRRLIELLFPELV